MHSREIGEVRQHGDGRGEADVELRLRRRQLTRHVRSEQRAQPGRQPPLQHALQRLRRRTNGENIISRDSAPATPF